MITRNYFKIVRVFPDPSDYFYIKNEGYESGNLWIGEVDVDTRTDLEFKIDNGSWTNFVETYGGGDYIELQPNSKLYLRGTAGYFKDIEGNGIWIDASNNVDTTISIGGDLRTLLNYTDVDSVTTIPEKCFSSAFADTNLISIDNLTLGSSVTTIGSSALEDMFYGSRIQKGLDLSNVTTLTGTYAMLRMYMRCSSLNEAYAPNLSTWSTSGAENWLNSVASTGVVYKPANLTIPLNWASGIPSNWTTQTYPNA